MDNKKLKEINEGKNLKALKEVSERFNVGRTVSHLQILMEKVTEKEINASTVNAACNCVQSLNYTIRTAVSAAKFLAEFNTHDREDYF